MKIKVIPISTAAITLENVHSEISQIAEAIETLQFVKAILLMGVLDSGFEKTDEAVRNSKKRQELLKEQYERYRAMQEVLSLKNSDVPSLTEKNFSGEFLRLLQFMFDAHLAEICTNVSKEILMAALKKRMGGTIKSIPKNLFIVTKVTRKKLKQKLVWSETHKYLQGFFEATEEHLFVMCPGVGFTSTGTMQKTRMDVIEETVKMFRNDSLFTVVSVKKLLETKRETQTASAAVA